MKIAIHASDLDLTRIDGTRVYILNLLKYFGKISPNDEFLIYHKGKFNPALMPPDFSNYRFKRLRKIFFWTQTSFAWSLWRDKPDCLWLPATNIPIIRRKSMKVVVTVHDMAYMYFPKMFPKKDIVKLKFFSKIAVNLADGIIAVSDSTKEDIFKFHKNIKKKKVKVIYHGFDWKSFKRIEQKGVAKKVLEKYEIKKKNYILYVGAIQPRKNLITLLQAFEEIKKKNKSLQLVIAGEKAWMWQEFINSVNYSKYKNDIKLTGKVSFSELPILYKNAKIFVIPSFYEGFGIVLLEAFASDIPVISAQNSSLTEVGGDAVAFFDAKKSWELARKIDKLINNSDLRKKLALKGSRRLKAFSWEKSAQQTLDFIKQKKD